MTTIAYKDGVLASDSALTGDRWLFAKMQKIIRIEGGRYHGGLAGAAGDLHDVAVFMKWARAGAIGDPPAAKGGADGLIIDVDGTILLWIGGDLQKIDGDMFAIGSGERFAVGAMAAGADAVEAVDIARRFDLYTDGPTQKIELNHQHT